MPSLTLTTKEEVEEALNWTMTSPRLRRQPALQRNKCGTNHTHTNASTSVGRCASHRSRTSSHPRCCSNLVQTVPFRAMHNHSSNVNHSTTDRTCSPSYSQTIKMQIHVHIRKDTNLTPWNYTLEWRGWICRQSARFSWHISNNNVPLCTFFFFENLVQSECNVVKLCIL